MSEAMRQDQVNMSMRDAANAGRANLAGAGRDARDAALAILPSPVRRTGGGRLARLAASFATVAFIGFGVLACFSDRDSIAGLIEGECAFAIDDDLLGSNRTLIAIRGFQFLPAQVTVARGTTVTWVNCEPAGTEGHTTTANAGAWSSPLLQRGQTFSHTFPAAGTFQYHCVPHPGMVGSVVVEE